MLKFKTTNRCTDLLLLLLLLILFIGLRKRILELQNVWKPYNTGKSLSHSFSIEGQVIAASRLNLIESRIAYFMEVSSLYVKSCMPTDVSHPSTGELNGFPPNPNQFLISTNSSVCIWKDDIWLSDIHLSTQLFKSSELICQ